MTPRTMLFHGPQAACGCSLERHAGRLIVLTGGPGAGRTAVLDVIRRTFCSHTVVLPNSAGILFQGGFPRLGSLGGRRAAQRAIFSIQRELERVALEEGKAALVICDGSTVDGWAYWPEQDEDFWFSVRSTVQAEHRRYRAVIHLRSPQDPGSIPNRRTATRTPGVDMLALDERLLRAWQGHPDLHVIESDPDFLQILNQVLALVRAHLPLCCSGIEPRELSVG